VKRTFTSKLSIMHGVQLLLPPRQSRGISSPFRMESFEDSPDADRHGGHSIMR
jgi:hypothetical protein